MTWKEEFGLLAWEGELRLSCPWPPTCRPQSGVYRLIALSSSGSPIAIPRACGDDYSGTLYIGQAGSLEGRVNELRKTLDPRWKSGSHGAGKLFLGTPALVEKYPTDKLATKWALCDSPWETEQRLLTTYAIQFGEGPPLNRQWSIPTYD